MSLDTWLAQRNPSLRNPPAKKSKPNSYDENSCSCSAGIDKETTPGIDSLPNSESQLVSPVILQDLPDSALNTGMRKFTSIRQVSPNQPRIDRISTVPLKFRSSSLTPLYDIPPEVRLGRPALNKWVASSHFDMQRSLTCVQCLPSAPYTVITGVSDTPTVHVLNCAHTAESLSDPGLCVSMKLPLQWPVHSMAMLDNSSILLGSSRGVAQVDLQGDKVIDTSRFRIAPTDEINTISSCSNGDSPLVAVGTASGMLQIWDVREKSWARSWTRTHAVTDGPKLNRTNPAVQHVVWTSDTKLATATKHNEAIKFWDLRARSKEPSMTTQQRTDYRAKGEFRGINGLAHDGSNVWGLNSSGEVLQVSSQQPMPELKSGFSKTNSSKPGQSLAFIDHDMCPLLACCGDRGVTLVTEPSLVAKDRNLDALQAVELYSPIGAVAVQWHPYVKQLISLSDCGWKWWIPKSELEERPAAIRSVRARMRPIHY